MVDPTGYTALDLIGFTDKGDYNPLSTYNKNDLANYNGTKWRCKVDDTIGVTPSEGLTWTAFMVLPTDHTMDMIAPVETSPSANAYVTGKQLIFNEVLYDVIDDIAIGDTLEVGVNIDTSDTIVEKIEEANGAIQQLTENIAPVEGATSLHAYVVGEQLIYNGTLYKVIAPIAVNDALVVDTNIEVSPKTVIEQVEDLDASKMSYMANTILGAHQLLRYPYYDTTKTTESITFTDMGDGAVQINGNKSSGNTAVFKYADRTVGSYILPAGRYRILKNITTAGISITIAYTSGGSGVVLATLNAEDREVEFTVTDSMGKLGIQINVTNGNYTDVTLNTLITLAEDTDRTVAPYTMTNRELTENMNPVRCTVSNFPTSTGSSYSLYKVGKIGILQMVAALTNITANTWTLIGTIDAGARPITAYFFACYIAGTSNAVQGLIEVDGSVKINSQTAGTINVRGSITYVIAQ